MYRGLHPVRCLSTGRAPEGEHLHQSEEADREEPYHFLRWIGCTRRFDRNRNSAERTAGAALCRDRLSPQWGSFSKALSRLGKPGALQIVYEARSLRVHPGAPRRCAMAHAGAVTHIHLSSSEPRDEQLGTRWTVVCSQRAATARRSRKDVVVPPSPANKLLPEISKHPSHFRLVATAVVVQRSPRHGIASRSQLPEAD